MEKDIKNEDRSKSGIGPPTDRVAVRLKSRIEKEKRKDIGKK